MFNRTRDHSPAIGERRTRTRNRARAAIAACVAVPVTALGVCLGGNAALAAGAAQGRAPAAVTVTWHELNLVNGWVSSQGDWNSGDPSYAISGGVVYLSGSLHGGISHSVFAVLPKAARPA